MPVEERTVRVQMQPQPEFEAWIAERQMVIVPGRDQLPCGAQFLFRPCILVYDSPIFGVLAWAFPFFIGHQPLHDFGRTRLVIRVAQYLQAKGPIPAGVKLREVNGFGFRTLCRDAVEAFGASEAALRSRNGRRVVGASGRVPCTTSHRANIRTLLKFDFPDAFPPQIAAVCSTRSGSNSPAATRWPNRDSFETSMENSTGGVKGECVGNLKSQEHIPTVSGTHRSRFHEKLTNSEDVSPK